MGTFCLEFPTPMGMAAVIAWHAFIPRGPGEIEFFNWYLVEKDATPEFKDLCRRAATLAFGSTGFVETDDADTWPQMTSASRGTMGRQQTIKYGALTSTRASPRTTRSGTGGCAGATSCSATPGPTRPTTRRGGTP
jgi:hypothetical protein